MKKRITQKYYAHIARLVYVFFIEDVPHIISAICIQIPTFAVKENTPILFQKFQKINFDC